MIRQDYILRMIEQAARMVARLMDLHKVGDLAGAQKLEAETALKFLDLDDGQLAGSDDEQVFDHIRSNGPTMEFPLRLGVAVSLLKSRAARAELEGDSASVRCFIATAIGVLLRSKIESQTADLPEFTPGLEDLLNSIPVEELPVRTAVLLVCYHEHIGGYAAAEDALFRLQELVGNNPEIERLGVGFYERLQRHSEEKLDRGGLSRLEVTQGLKQWRRLLS